MSAAQPNSSLPVQQILNNCRRQIFVHTLLVGLATLAAVAVGYVVCAGLLDYIVGLPSTLRAGIMVSFIIVVLVVAWKSLVAPLTATLPNEQLGAAVDLSSPELQESLATLISIERPGASASETGSVLMRRHLRQQVSQHLKGVSGNSVVDVKLTLRRCGIAGLVIMLAALPCIAWPSSSSLLVQRMIAPFENLATVSNLYFEVPNGNRVVARGSNIEISALPKWRSQSPGERPDVVNVRLIGNNGQSESVPMMFDAVGNRYVTELARIAESVQYQLVGGGATTEVFQLTVVDAPEVLTAVMTATPPVYSGRAIERFDGVVGEIEVFEKSELEVLLEFNKPIHHATLRWAARDARPVTEAEMLEIEFDDLSGEEVMEIDMEAPLMAVTEELEESVSGELSTDGLSAIFHMTADAGGDFAFEILDEYELPNTEEPDRHLTVVFDAPPGLDVSGIHDVDEFRPDDILPVNCVVVDDIGIGDIALHYQINGDVEKLIAAGDFDRGSQEVRHPFRVQLEDLGVADGDVLKIRVRATDERPDPAPQETWSQTYTIGIDNNAKAAGQRALEEDTREMVAALRQLEKLLGQDIETAKELKEKTRKGWTEDSRDETQRLSEKEQQQGQILEMLAEDVAKHPLMQDSAKTLQLLSQTLREELPETLGAAADADRRGANEHLKQAAEELSATRESLREEIERIEQAAHLEQDLAELSRLALEAEQLAKDADQLDEDRKDDENQPADVNDKDWQQQLDQRQQELAQQQNELSDELGRLLQEQQQLLEAAQRAQREELTELSDVAKQLAQRQQQLANSVENEAQDAARDARQIAKELTKAAADVERLNGDLPEQDGVQQADIDKLKQAIEQLKQGDLAQPDQPVSEVADNLRQNEQQLREGAQSDQPVEQREASEEAAQRSGDLAKRLEDIRKRAAELRDERVVPAAEELPKGENPPQGAVANLLERLDDLAEEAQQMAEDVHADTEATPPVQNAAERAANEAQQSADEAATGEFSEAAQDARQAAAAARQAGQQMNTAAQAERREQSEALSNNLNQMAEQLQALQQSDASQVAAQQQTQQSIADEAAQLPEQLQDLAERLNLDSLQMEAQAQQAEAAQQAAGQAQQSSQQASSELQQGDLQSAGEAGETTASELERLSELAQQAGQSPGQQQAAGEQQTQVPTEVGESVAEALQDLEQAAQAMQQDSEQSGSGEAGESAEQGGQGQSPGAEGESAEGGQPGESGQSSSGQPGGNEPGQSQPGQSGQPGQPSGSQQLSAAAKALAQAAQGALPGQFNPGQMSESGDSPGTGSGGQGNDGLWSGLLPNHSNGPDNTRDWGGLNEELDTETSDGVSFSRDVEYDALIRMYFREVAKAVDD